jgi:hypothetical protein
MPQPFRGTPDETGNKIQFVLQKSDNGNSLAVGRCATTAGLTVSVPRSVISMT